ncbi:MAG: rhomboid family intramembrane serine protease [Lutibacter sp.]|nr:rhomboid family intramembrane serine protease [Lutibacter sp.]
MLGTGNKTNLNDGTKLTIINDIKNAYHNANAVEKIIYLNVFFFLTTVLFTAFSLQWLALPADFNSFLSKPWTLISYAFIHERLFHVLSNLLVLYYVGNLFMDFYSKKQFINCYFSGIIVGGITFLSYYYFTSKVGASLGGASAAVSAIFVALATKIPRYALRLRFIGSVELWVLAAIWVVLSILQLATANNGGAIAHLGGATFGFIYANQLEKGNDLGKWLESILDFFANAFKTKKSGPLKTVYKSGKKSPSEQVSKTKQRKINDILDKISKSGYESLSQEEKDFLFRSGKE